jgi:hypothetical protein
MGFTTADLGAEIMREMEEVARIASVCSNMKGALERRLASGRVRASSAEPQQRTVATSAVASTVADLCPLRIRDDGVGDDDMRMVESVRTETIDKDVKPNNGQEHADGSYLRERVRSLESEVSRLQETVERHDTSGAPLRAGTVYCWSEEIAHLREVCIRARYRNTRSRRGRRWDEATVAYLYNAYREARSPLQQAIKEAKRRAWDELLATLDSDP